MTTQTYVYTLSTPGLSNFVMPSGFSSTVDVYLWGAGGANSTAGVGGGGGYAHSTVVINPGDVVKVGIGQAGIGRNGGDNGFTNQFFGGYAGFSVDEDNDTGIAGGGGAASVLTINNVIKVVAAGGGGAGGLGDLDESLTLSATNVGGLPGGKWTSLNTDTTGGIGSIGASGGAGGGGGYPLGGAGSSGTPDDANNSLPGSGGQNFGDYTESGTGSKSGGQNSLYKSVTNFGDAGQQGYGVLVFQRSYTLYNKKANSWRSINNAWVKVDNVWKPISSVWTKIENNWRPILSTNTLTVTNTELSPSPGSAPTIYSPGFIISSNVANVNEGEAVSFSLNTSNIPDNTILYWTTNGTAANNSRFTDNVTSGNLTITNGHGSIIRPLLLNSYTNGETNFTISIHTTSINGNTVITSSPVIVNDTSNTPGYSISSNVAGVNEGNSVLFYLTTINVPNNTPLYWDTSGTAANSSRFTDNITGGNISISNNRFNLLRTLSLDQVTEGTTSFSINVYSDYTKNLLVATSNTVTVADISTTPYGYSITPDRYNAIEGSSVIFTINTTNIPNNTTLYWNTSGSAANTTRFSDGQISGSFVVNNNTAQLTRTLANNQLTDGPTNFKIELRTGSINGTIVSTSATVNVADTSQTPATYTLAASASTVNEGSSVFFNLSTTNVPDGTILYWTTNGTCATTSRFTDNQVSGSITIAGGVASITRALALDKTTEGSTSFSLSIRTGSASGTIVTTSASVTVNDTSTAPIIPSYNVSASSYNINEGDTVTFTLATTGVSDNTTLYWTAIGTTTNTSYLVNPVTMKQTASSRFTDGLISGTVVVVNGSATLSRSILSNYYTDGTTSFAIQIRTGSKTGMIVATSGTVTVNDTSTIPTVSYSIIPSQTTVNETSNPTVVFTIKTTGVADGTVLNLKATLDSSRFTDGINSGQVTVSSQSAAVSRTIKQDFITEGDSTFTVQAYNSAGTLVAESPVITVLDTSHTLPGSMSWSTPGTYTWKVPLGITSVSYSVYGGGGSGGSANEVGAGGAGGGGGSGGFISGTATVIPGETLSIVVGAGGSPSTAAARGGVSNGNTGGSSSLSGSPGSVVATGGQGGTGGNNAYGGPGGAGGLPSGVAGSDGQAGWSDSASPQGGSGGVSAFGGGSSGASAIDRTSPLYWNSQPGQNGRVTISWS